MPAAEVTTRERILRQSLQLFARKGYDATSVREICEAAGLAKPTLYHFFGSKEGVYRCLVDGSLDDFRQQILRVLAGEGSAEERLRRVARLHFSTARAESELMRFIFSLIHNPPSSAPKSDFPRFYEGVVEGIAQ